MLRVATVRPMTARLLMAAVTLVAIAATAPAATAGGSPGYDFAASVARAGPRPAASAAERRAQLRVRAAFKRAGLSLASDRFTVPGKGRSRNVIGIRDGASDCLVVLMAHSDTMPRTPGAEDNASGLAHSSSWRHDSVPWRRAVRSGSWPPGRKSVATPAGATIWARRSCGG